MRINRIIRKKLDDDSAGQAVAGGVNAVISANVNEPGHSHTSVSSKQRIVQRNGKTIVHEEETREESR